MDVIARNNVVSTGRADGQPMLFSHGFGCDQNMWRHVAPAFEDRYRVVLFDHVGAGRSDLAAYDRQRYSTLAGYAEDVPTRFRRGTFMEQSGRKPPHK